VTETPVHITGIDVPAHSQVTVTFRVTVNSTLPAGVTQISNQGMVFYDSNEDGNNDATQQTDGDTAQPGEQATIIPVTAGPTIPTLEVAAIKSVEDENGGNVEPGDSLRYTILMQNQSGFDVNGMEFTDAIPANTTYIAESATAPLGSVVVTQTPELKITGINVPAHSQVSVTFRVTVNTPVPDGVTEISNQGTVSYDSNWDGNNDATQDTDGDTTQPGEQPTVIPVVAGPTIPTLNEWGMMLFGCLMLVSGIVMMRRKRTA